jgi:hypothetical protein
MRTKTLLLACAALALGLATSQAQVYSQNVVGYANVVLKGNGQYNLIANPFDDGNGNYLTNLLNSALPKQSQCLTFDNIAGFTTVTKVGSPPNWPAGTATQLIPGSGFFVRNGSVGSGAPDLTNTFVGTVIVNTGLTVTNTELIGYTLQASPIPYAGNLAVATTGDGDANMDFGGPLTKQSQILTFDPVAGYTTVTKVGNPATWPTTVSVGVGQGFFIFNKSGPATNVVETLTP